MSILAIDLGGTTAKIGRVAADKVEARGTIASRSDAGVASLLDDLRDAIAPLLTPSCSQLAIGVPTLVDVRSQRIMSPMQDKFADLDRVDLSAWSRASFGLPIMMENDAHAAMLGEWRCGAGADCTDVVMLTLGTGIGSSVIINARPLRGRTGQAGNLCGHLVLDPDGPPCGCGGRGCYEAMQHLNHVRQLARADAAFAKSTLSTTPDFDYARLFQSAADGDGLAIRLRDRSLSIWSSLVITLIHTFDPQRIIVGGGIVRAGDDLLKPLNDAASRAWTPGHQVPVIPASLGDDAALLGLDVLCNSPLEYL